MPSEKIPHHRVDVQTVGGFLAEAASVGHPVAMTRIAIVVDRKFGERLSTLAAYASVWICDSPTNRLWIDALWALNESDVTRFSARDEDGPEAMALGILSTVDEHHGELGEIEAWSELEFVGVDPSDILRAELAERGVDRFESTQNGFIATRRL